MTALYDRFQHRAKTGTSTGKRDNRSPIAKDRDRIIHASALRRLQGKSQIVGVEVGDFFRTRITHTLECAQVGRGIARNVKESSAVTATVDDSDDFPDLVEAACLAHDLGHPPFGHNGEKALAKAMRNYNKSLFEGNAQSFRVVTYLEPKCFGPTRMHPQKYRWLGLDLTRATLRAVVKYPEIESATMLAEEEPKFGCYDDSDDREYYDWVWNGQAQEKTLAAKIMDASDDIAYAVHDFEDGVWAGMIPIYELLSGNPHYLGELERKVSELDAKSKSGPIFSQGDFTRTFDDLFKTKQVSQWLDYLGDIGYDRTREARASLKNFTAWLIGELIDDVSATGTFVEPKGDVARRIRLLKAMAWQWMIERTDLETIHWGQERLIRRIFEGYWDHPEMLPRQLRWGDIGQSPPAGYRGRKEDLWPAKARLICDHIAGMTDGYAHAVYDQMYRATQRRDLRLAY